LYSTGDRSLRWSYGQITGTRSIDRSSRWDCLLIKALDAYRTEFNIASLEPLIKQCFSDYVKRLEAETDLRKTMSSIDANDEVYRRD